MQTQRFASVLPALLALFVAQPALAGGLYLSEFATGDMGAAGAGILAGGAGDGSALTANPAAATLADSHQLHLGLAPGFSVVEFDADSDTPVAGGDGGDQGDFIPLLSSNYVHRLSDRFRVGFGLVSVAGAALDPGNSWAGRNQVTSISLLSVSAVPVVAYQVNDWLSIGAGPAITYAKLDWKLKVPLPGPGGNESKIELDGIDDTEVSAVVGVLIQPLENLRIGFVYQSEVDLKLTGDLDGLRPAGPIDIDVELPLAEAFRAEAVWDVNEKVTLSLGGAHENWSALGTTDVSLGAIESSVRIGFRDTWKLRGGFHYNVNDRLMLQTGVSYDSSALKKSDRMPALPIDEQWRVGVGGVYKWTEDKTLSFSFQYANLGNAPIDNAALKGDYDSNDVYLFQMGIKFKKLPWDGKLSF